MVQWFETLTMLERVYLYLAVPATLVLLLQTVLTIIGLGQGGSDFDADTELDADMDMDADVDMDMDMDADVDVDVDTDVDSDADVDGDGDGDGDSAEGSGAYAGLRVFTLRGFVAFFSIFGWAGLFFASIGFQSWLGLLLAQALGALAMLSVALVFRAMRRLASSGTLDLSGAVGKSASVYLTIPEGGEDPGKVMLVLQERLVELDAVTDCGRAIQTGELVTVNGMRDPNTLLVRPDDTLDANS